MMRPWSVNPEFSNSSRAILRGRAVSCRMQAHLLSWSGCISEKMGSPQLGRESTCASTIARRREALEGMSRESPTSARSESVALGRAKGGALAAEAAAGSATG